MLKLSTDAKKVITALQKKGYKAYIVGGCVRDYLMGIEPDDIDITTDAKPFEIQEVFAGYRTVETGIKHGTVTVLADSGSYEITTFRIDAAYSDNRHPDSVKFTGSLKEDLARRDFTMNAVAYNEEEGFIDYFGGREDIGERVIRCVGDPDKRFNEDALRILRALRFSSVTGFEIEKATKEAIIKNKNLLNRISAERIYVEISKMLCGDNIKDILLRDIDVLGVVIPELLHMKNFDQKNHHHIYDALTHTAVVTESIEKNPYLRFAALFHDIGKPHTFSLGEDGMGHFYGHASVSMAIAESVLKRLKADNVTSHKVLTLIKYHDTPLENKDIPIKKKLNQLGADMFFDLIKLMRADNIGQHPDFSYRQKAYDEIEKRAYEIINKKECFSLKDLEIDGEDLIDMGMTPGKEIGVLLDKLLDKVISGSVINSREALLKTAKLLLNESL